MDLVFMERDMEKETKAWTIYCSFVGKRSLEIREDLRPNDRSLVLMLVGPNDSQSGTFWVINLRPIN
jgi:hypothetical protein